MSIPVGTENRRGLAKTFDLRALGLAAISPILFGCGLAIWLLSVAHRLPDPMASHWSGAGPADGFSSFTANFWTAVLVVMGTGLLLAFCFSFRGTQPGMRRFGVSFAAVISGSVTALLLAGFAPQVDRTSAVGTEMSWSIAWIPLAAGVLLALALQALVGKRPAVPVASDVPRDALRNDAGAQQGESLSARIKAAAGLMVFLVIVAVVSTGALAFASPWLILPAAILWIAVISLCFATVQAGPDGISVRVLGRWRILHLPISNYSSVEAKEMILPMQYGGWGYRIGSWGTAFILRSGPAVILKVADNRDCTISLDTVENAQQIAALLNSYKELETHA